MTTLISGVFTTVLACSSCTPTTDQSNNSVSKPTANKAPELISPPEPSTLLLEETVPDSDFGVNHTSSYALPPNLTELPAANQLRNNKSAPPVDSGSSVITVPPIPSASPE